MSNVEYGGTGFFYDKAPKLPDEIEHHFPDYHLYNDFVREKIESGRKRIEFKEYLDMSIGFTTRGCIRQCKFCVNQNYKKASVHSCISEFFDPTRKYICLLDDNVMACKEWKSVFDELIATGHRFYFKQGMDERLLTDKKCEYLFNKSKWYGDYIFAFDNIKDQPIIERKLALIRKHTDKLCKFYTFTGFNHDNPGVYSDEFWAKDIVDLFERIRILMSYRCLPYVMRFKDYELSPYRGMYINIARWCNQPSFFKKKTFREFCHINGENSACMKYANEFEKKFPEVAEKYFDIRWQ